jgi:hypothetical protein
MWDAFGVVTIINNVVSIYDESIQRKDRGWFWLYSNKYFSDVILKIWRK